jgi:hypothetical protein
MPDLIRQYIRRRRCMERQVKPGSDEIEIRVASFNDLVSDREQS